MMNYARFDTREAGNAYVAAYAATNPKDEVGRPIINSPNVWQEWNEKWYVSLLDASPLSPAEWGGEIVEELPVQVVEEMQQEL